MNFDAAVDILLSPLVEGGYSNNPRDPGGETRWGITRRTAHTYGYDGDMRILPKELARTIYKQAYWDPLMIDDLPDTIRYCMFDGAVNEGVDRISDFLHECLELQSGPVDQGTLVAAGMLDGLSLYAALLAKRVRHYTSLPTWGMFGRGWANRVATNLEVTSNLKGTA